MLSMVTFAITLNTINLHIKEEKHCISGLLPELRQELFSRMTEIYEFDQVRKM